MGTVGVSLLHRIAEHLLGESDLGSTSDRSESVGSQNWQTRRNADNSTSSRAELILRTTDPMADGFGLTRGVRIGTVITSLPR